MDTDAIYQRYLMAGAMRRDPDAVAALFTEDGVLEAPLVPAGHAYPRRLEGRDAIRGGLAEFYRRPQPETGAIDVANTRMVLHHAAPDTLIAEIDTAFVDAPTMSLVHVVRFRDDLIAHLRDYFDPGAVA